VSRYHRILVTGSRKWTDREIIFDAICPLLDDHNAEQTIIHGAAPGADSIAAGIAQKLGLKAEAYPADWVKHGNAAGPIRNTEMVKSGADLCLAFPLPGTSRGTWDCVRKAVDAGIPVRIFPGVVFHRARAEARTREGR